RGRHGVTGGGDQLGTGGRGGILCGPGSSRIGPAGRRSGGRGGRIGPPRPTVYGAGHAGGIWRPVSPTVLSRGRPRQPLSGSRVGAALGSRLAGGGRGAGGGRPVCQTSPTPLTAVSDGRPT